MIWWALSQVPCVPFEWPKKKKANAINIILELLYQDDSPWHAQSSHRKDGPSQSGPLHTYRKHPESCGSWKKSSVSMCPSSVNHKSLLTGWRPWCRCSCPGKWHTAWTPHGSSSLPCERSLRRSWWQRVPRPSRHADHPALGDKAWTPEKWANSKIKENVNKNNCPISFWG